MIRIIKKNTRINFIGHRKIAFVISILLITISLGSLATKGLQLDVDFTGGLIVNVDYPESVELNDVRSALADSQFEGALVQYFGSSKEVMIRLGAQETEGSKETAKVSNRVLEALQAKNPQVELQKVEFVGSQVSDELVNKGSLALLYTIIGILIYVMVRFHWKLACGTVVALTHDVIITLGAFSLFGWQFDLSVLAALLAILGYSVNDTIIIFDRQRENYRRLRKAGTVEVMNVSINETLSRTLITVLTVLLTLFALLFIGGDSVHWFSLAMVIGTLFGTYSSVYIASAIALQLKVTREDIYPPKEDGEKMPEMP